MERRESSRPVLLVGGDLNAVARVEAACAAAGRPFLRTTVERLAAVIETHDPVLAIVDLDDVPDALQLLPSDKRDRAIAFFSHVDTQAGQRAAEGGLRVLPRGRFWRELPQLVRSLPEV